MFIFVYFTVDPTDYLYLLDSSMAYTKGGCYAPFSGISPTYSRMRRAAVRD